MTQPKRPLIDESVTAYLRTLVGTDQSPEMVVGNRAVSRY
jgi:hypothetical protein